MYSVIVWPDSFGDFAELKKLLISTGFQYDCNRSLTFLRVHFLEALRRLESSDEGDSFHEAPPLPPPKRTPPRNESRPYDQQTIVVWVLSGMAVATLLLLMLIALISRREEIGGQQLGSQDSQVESFGELNAQSSNSTTSENSAPQSENVASEDGTSTSSPAMPTTEDRSEAPSESPSESSVPQSEKSEVVAPRSIQIFDGSGAPPLAIGASSAGGANPFLGSRDAKQVVFVIDKSGSMAGGALERVKSALIEAIEALTDQQKFQVIFFESTAVFHPSLQGLVAANRANKSSYVNWIWQMQAMAEPNRSRP